MKTEHILIIRLSALGDIAMTVPVIYSLATQYPNLRITMFSRPYARPLFEHMPPNVGFMEADIKHEYHGIRGLNALYRRLTAKNFTAIADLHNVLRSYYLRMRFNLDRYHVEHIDKHRSGRRLLVSQTNKKLVQQPTAIQNYCDVFRRLGYPVKIQFKSIFGEEGSNLKLISNKVGTKPIDKQWIGIAPFAAHQGKVYPIENMKKVIRLTHERHQNARFFIFGGGKEEKQLIKSICEEMPYCVNVPDTLNGLEEELILMNHLNVMVSMDSANMHLASIVGVPVVSIWGSTHPYAGFMGWNQNPSNAVQLDLSCRPCSIFGTDKCLRGDFACLKNITPEMVVQRLEMILFNNK